MVSRPRSIITVIGIGISIPISNRRLILLKHLSAAQSLACVNEFCDGGAKFNVTNF